MNFKWEDTKYFPGRRCDVVQRRVYFEYVASLVGVLGGTVTVERALGVPKGTLYKRASGKLPLRYESLLAVEALASRLGAAPAVVVEELKDFLRGELHAG